MKAPSAMLDRGFQLKGWTVRPTEGTLEAGEQVAHLEPRVMTLLVCLASRAGEVVLKEELLQSVWGDTFVEEGALSRCVSDIRQALGDKASAPEYVETIPKRGYRLLAEVTLAPGHEQREPSIAVLPFIDLSAAQDQAYFADGIAEELIHGLAQIEGLQVVARTSAFQFQARGADVREVGEALGAATVVEGSVRRSEDRLRIAVQLIDARTGFHIWSERYDREHEDVFDIQDEIARSVVERVRPELLKDRGRLIERWTDNLEVHDLCLVAAHEAAAESREGLQKAVALYRQGIEIDPKCAQAWAGLANALTVDVIYGFAPQTQLEEARDTAQQAIELAADLSLAYVALAMIELYEWHWQAALDACLRARSLNPGEAFTRFVCRVVLQSLGRVEEACNEARVACELNPLAALYHRGLGTTLLLNRQWQECLPHLERSLELNSQQPYCRLTLAHALWQLGRQAESLALLRTHLDEPSSDKEQEGDEEGATRDGELRDLVGRWRQTKPRGDWFFIAIFQVLLGEHDAALSDLERALEERESPLTNLEAWPTLDELRNTARFQAIRTAMGLTELD